MELIRENKISGAIGKQVIEDMFKGDTRAAQEIVEEKGLMLTDDTNLLEEICRKVGRTSHIWECLLFQGRHVCMCMCIYVTTKTI